MKLAGRSPLGPDGNYDREREEDLNVLLARLLTGALAGLVFLTARLRLSLVGSLALTVVAVFGTQIYSTASRGLWSDTWGILLVATALFLLLRAEDAGPDVSGALLGLLLGLLVSAAYACRPTNALAVLALAIYLLRYRRRSFWPFLLTSSLVGGGIVLYAELHFRTLLPLYFRASGIPFRGGVGTLALNLFSPGRGLLVYVPAIFALIVLLVRGWGGVRPKRLAVTASALAVGYVVVISGFETTGGHAFGPRLMTGLVPWLVLLAVIAADAGPSGRPGSGGAKRPHPGLIATCALFSLASVAINAVGATSRDAARWNLLPVNVDRHPERIWQWRQPQFLAPFLDPPGPFPPITAEGLPFGSAAGDAYVGRGWDYGDGVARWTDGTTATFRFRLERRAPGTLEIELRPYLGGGRLPAQRLGIDLNGQPLGDWTIREAGFLRQAVPVPAEHLALENVVRFHLPDAASPHAVEPRSGDRRQLGIQVREVRWSER
jgi:hypothetical protein